MPAPESTHLRSSPSKVFPRNIGRYHALMDEHRKPLILLPLSPSDTALDLRMKETSFHRQVLVAAQESLIDRPGSICQ
jgi:hypothetical protein